MRDAKLTLIIGTNRTGKTTLQKQLLDLSHQRAIIITPDYKEWRDKDMNGNELYPLIERFHTQEDFVYDGYKRMIYDKDTLSQLLAFKKGIIILDDCRAYLNDRIEDDLRKLLIRRGQNEVDIFMTAHSFNQVPRQVFNYVSDIFLFRTHDNIQMRAGVINNIEALQRIQAYVNRKSREIINGVENKHFFQHFHF